MKCPHCGEYFVDGEDRCPACDHPLTPAAHLKSARPARVQGYSRRFITVLALVFLAGGVLSVMHGVLASRDDTRAWKRYDRSAGHFSVRLPSVPETKATVLKFADGSITTRYSLISTTKTCAYYVEYVDYAVDLQQARDVVPRLLRMKQAELRQRNGTLVSQQPSRYLGYPGAYVVYNMPWVQVREHLFAKGNRVYSIHADYVPRKAENGHIKRFFSSVRITEE
ncbi:MAG: hypothetical protein ACYC6A_24720 [Armatimonadota bacterium]